MEASFTTWVSVNTVFTSHQAPQPPKPLLAVAFGTADAPNRLALAADAAWRLGPRPIAQWLRHRAGLALGLPQRGLRGAKAVTGTFLPTVAPPAPPGGDAAVLRAVAALPERFDWHESFDPASPAIGFDLFRAGDVRPVWEASRLAALPLLAQAARIDPAGGHLARAEALLADWCAANPPFRGPNWACGQEAAFRALHLVLTLALLDADHAPPPGACGLLMLCARRIAATPHYAAAQDNNHAISEPAGAFACALVLGDRAAAARHGRVLAARVARLVAPDGGFAQVSPGYARLLLDTLSVVEWLRTRHGLPAFPAPLAARASACARWLHRLTEPNTGTTPRIGVEDGSALADLSLAGPRDARPSVERAARLFAGAGADLPGDAGCAWLGLSLPTLRLDRPARWQAAGSMGWASGRAMAVLRGGRLRFRPSQADLLHLTLRDGGVEVLRDAGTGAYNPPSPWWWAALSGASAHNGAVFDAAEPMPRAGRFLLARWPSMVSVAGGLALRDQRGNRQTRKVAVEGRVWTVIDDLGGPFRAVALHWRLPAGNWALRPDGVSGEALRIDITADAPVTLRLAQGWESPCYGQIAPAPLLVVEGSAPLTRIATRVTLPARAA